MESRECRLEGPAEWLPRRGRCIAELSGTQGARDWGKTRVWSAIVELVWERWAQHGGSGELAGQFRGKVQRGEKVGI